MAESCVGETNPNEWVNINDGVINTTTDNITTQTNPTG